MLDRLSAGLVNLPTSTYDLVLILADASSMLGESLALMNRTVLGPVAEALKPNGRLQGQNGNNLEESTLSKEAVLAGLVASRGGFEKPDYGESEGVVSLKFGSKKKKNQGGFTFGDGSVSLKRSAPKVEPPKPVAPAGVGFIDLSDDFDDDDLIDEDDLMTEEDLLRPINIRTFPHLSDPSPTPHFPLLLTSIQPPSASPSPASEGAPARIVRVVLPNASSPKTMPSVPKPTRNSRASSLPLTIWRKSTLPSRARWAPVATAP